MRVLLSHTMFDGSDYYRVREPARAVAEADLGISVTVNRGLMTTMAPPPGGGELVVVDVDAKDADVVVLQLPKTLEMLQILRILQARGVAVVVEMDDSYSNVPFGHMGHDALVRRGVHRIVMACAHEADLVTTSTPALLEEYAPHGRGVVVPNAVPRRNAELPPAYERDPEILTIGWAGSVPHHPYDLQEMGSGLQQALDRSAEARFAILGNVADARERMRLACDPVHIPWVSGVDNYVQAVGEQFDIGVAPLRIDRFNTCKSWLKPLEYAARGIYCVRSRTDEYERLGVGRPARSAKDWARFISAGTRSADLRREVASADREKILASHLTEHTAERWASAWRQARDHRSRMQRKGA